MGKKTLVCLCFWILSLTLTITSANTLNVVRENDTVIIVADVQDEDGLGSFSLTIKYDPSKTKIINVSPEEPFTVVSNIDNTNGIAKVAGFHGQIPGPRGKVKLAKLSVDGLLEFEVINVKLYDTKGDLIFYYYSNKTISNKTIITVTTLPPTTTITATSTTSPTITVTYTVATSSLTISTSPQASVPASTVTLTTTKVLQQTTISILKQPSQTKRFEITTLNATITSTQPIPEFLAECAVFAVILITLLMLRKRKD